MKKIGVLAFSLSISCSSFSAEIYTGKSDGITYLTNKKPETSNAKRVVVAQSSSSNKSPIGTYSANKKSKNNIPIEQRGTLQSTNSAKPSTQIGYAIMNGTYSTDEDMGTPPKTIKSSKPISINQQLMQYYSQENIDPEFLKQHTLEYLKVGEEPQIILVEASSRTEKDFNEITADLLSKSFINIARSYFISPEISKSEIIDFAKLKRIKYVVVLKGSLDKRLSFDVGSSTDAKNKSIINQLNIDASEYYIFYFIKDITSVPNAIGIKMRNLSQDERLKYQTNTGVTASVILDKSKAFFSNVLKNDVITKINGKKLVDVEEFNKLKNEILKTTSTLELTILRDVNGQIKELVIPITME